MVEEDHPGGLLDGGRHTEVEQVLRQAVAQSLSTGFLQADPVALASELRGLVTFVDRDADPGLLESLRQAQAADAAADDEDMERGWCRPRTGLAASVVSAVIFDHRSQASR